TKASSQITLEKHTLGRNQLPVWKFFYQKRISLPGHFLAKCSYCPAKWLRGELQKLEAYLALEYPNVDNEI
ncbi:24315_t:CDS:2, partial [Dentiscutata erythropus]